MADDEDKDWSNDETFVDLIKAIVDQICSFEDEIIPKTSIYQRPSKLDIKNTNSPHFVSIGPIHDGQADLVAMEEIKLWYSMFFFYRFKEPAQTMLKCGEAIIKLHKTARKYYAHDLQTLNEYKLMKILLIDGCFLLELFLRHSNERDYTFLKENKIDKYRETETITYDHILGNPWMHRAVFKDLVLLENQIPLVVLESLLSFVKPSLKSSNGFKDYALYFFCLNLNASKATPIWVDLEAPRPTEEPRHILEILHQCLLPSWKLENGKKRYELINSATKLLEFGVNIKKNVDLSNETDDFNINLLEIKFDSRKGILKVPQFWIGGTTSLITKNLVDFEQCCSGRSQSHHVTAYVIFMKSLISSEHDIKLLKRKGIIMTQPGSGSKENVMEFFNACSEGVALKDYYFSNVCVEVEEYSKNWMHFYSYVICQRKGRKFICMAITYLGAATLLILTFLQTFFTIYPNFQKR